MHVQSTYKKAYHRGHGQDLVGNVIQRCIRDSHSELLVNKRTLHHISSHKSASLLSLLLGQSVLFEEGVNLIGSPEVVVDLSVLGFANGSKLNCATNQR